MNKQFSLSVAEPKASNVKSEKALVRDLSVVIKVNKGVNYQCHYE